MKEKQSEKKKKNQVLVKHGILPFTAEVIELPWKACSISNFRHILFKKTQNKQTNNPTNQKRLQFLCLFW